MFKRIKILLILVSLSITLCLMSNTYSRYVASSTSNVDILFADWQILVNQTDITTGVDSTINFTPVIMPNNNVANNVFAPSSTGYLDIAIDPTNVDVSFKYDIGLQVDNPNMLDLKITEYEVISGIANPVIEPVEDPDPLVPGEPGESSGDAVEENEVSDPPIVGEGDEQTTPAEPTTSDPITIVNNTLTDSLYYDNNVENFSFQPFTLRIYFEWYEGENELMNDEADTNVATVNNQITINANISFEQIIQ